MGTVCSRCLPFLPFFSQEGEDQQRPLLNGKKSGEGGGTAAAPRHSATSRKVGWRRFEFKIRGREFGLELPAGCTQVESGDHKLAVFEGREFNRELVDLLRFENPELCFMPIFQNRRLVLGDCIPAGSRPDNVATFFIPQLDTAQARFGLGHRWMRSSPGTLYVNRERRKQFCPDLDVTDCEAALAADRELQAAGSEALVYYDLPVLLALEVMAESDDPANIDRKCRAMVEAGAARTAVGLFVWDPAKPPFDGTVKVYRRREDSDPRLELGAEDGDRDVAVEEYHRPRFVPLDCLHEGMRLYLSALPEYAWPSQGLSQVKTGDWQMLLSACCDVRDPEMVKEAINYVGSLNLQDSNGRLCMVEAAKAGDVSLLDYMHRHGASLDREDAEDVSPYLAARAQHRAEACKWLEDRGCVLHPPTALDQAIRSRKTRVVEYLLLAGETEKFTAGEQGSWSPGSLSRSLSTAMRVWHEDAVKMLLDKGCKPTDNVLNLKLLLNVIQKADQEAGQTSWSPRSLSTCLSTAIKVSNEGLVKALLARGCKPTLQDHYRAALSSDPSILNLLLDTHTLSDEELSEFLLEKESLAQESPSLVAGASPAA